MLNNGRDGRTNRPAGSWLESFLWLLYPDRCLGCAAIFSGPQNFPLCRECGHNFCPAGILCPSCSTLHQGFSGCGCSAGKPLLQSVLALTYYDQRWRAIIHAFKYHHRRHIGRALGIWLGSEIASQLANKPLVMVPIPLYAQRKTERGFNQSELMAHHAAKVTGHPCLPLLQKNRDTFSQATLSRRERYANVSGVFSLSKAVPPGREVLLIDDIYSTGATMWEAASVFCRLGVRVRGAVVAYNPSRHGTDFQL